MRIFKWFQEFGLPIPLKVFRLSTKFPTTSGSVAAFLGLRDMADKRPGRVVIENVQPIIDNGRFPLVRCLNDAITIRVDLFADGHDFLDADLLVTNPENINSCYPFESIGHYQDTYTATIPHLDKIGQWHFQIHAWIETYQTWLHEIEKKIEAGVNISLELQEGAILVRKAIKKAENESGNAAHELIVFAELLEDPARTEIEKLKVSQSDSINQLMRHYGDRGQVSELIVPQTIRVDRERAVHGAWYEMFPRSASSERGRHGTFHDVIGRLDEIASMGFDVLYLPPIHPIGLKFRKGPNNSLTAGENDPGSPWAIGCEFGGHTAVHPELGTIEDFQTLVEEAAKREMEIALDIAFQCAPDHPWLKEHPHWFQIRPDGSIRYAENPPKKYQDIHPLNFECEDWQNLWNALRDIFLYWAGHGVRVFRVDNPHTKPFPFWEWCLSEVQKLYPDVIFLAEAFTRPKLMKRLAKAGFTQSYTYFTWRNDKQGLIEYFQELTLTECREYFRPNLFANTPDILNDFLVQGGPIAFRIRFILAATLGATYGIYGPPFELCVNQPVKAGSEEYLDSEKYEIRHWNHEEPQSLKPLIRHVNMIRRANPALQRNETLVFHEISHPDLIAYSKIVEDRSNCILVIVNLNPNTTSVGFLKLDLSYFDINPADDFFAHDLLTDDFYRWNGSEQYIELSPERTAHIFRLEQT